MVYIVDDDDSVRKSYEILLKSSNLSCKSFSSANDFLSSNIETKNNVLILDMHMPDMSGCSVLDKLTENGIKLPVIVVTAFDEPASRKCAEKYGVIGFLKKPVDSKQLIKLINSHRD